MNTYIICFYNILNYTSYIIIRISGGFSLSLTVKVQVLLSLRWRTALAASHPEISTELWRAAKDATQKTVCEGKHLGFQPSLRCDLFIFVHVDFNGILIGFHRFSMGFFHIYFFEFPFGFFKRRFLFVKTECSDEDLSRPEIGGVCPEIWSRNGRLIP